MSALEVSISARLLPQIAPARFSAAGFALLIVLLWSGPGSGRVLAAEESEPPDEAMAACYRGSAAQGHDQHHLAISYYNECLAWAELPSETLALVLTNRATSRQLTQDYEGALRDYTAAIEIDPERANSYNGRCWTYALLRRTQAALADCEESLRLAPDDPYALDSRALVFWLMSRDDFARADLERARSLDPAFPPWQKRFKDFEKLVFGIDP